MITSHTESEGAVREGCRTKTVTVIDYGMGNIGSILNMLKKIGAVAVSSDDPGDIGRAERLILPGVGSFDSGMEELAKRGLIEALNKAVLLRRVPFLGICLGMQLLSRSSEEGKLPGLGWIDSDTVRLPSETQQGRLRIPHMGWNSVTLQQEDRLFEDLPEARFYFVHSYHVVCHKPEDVVATTSYGAPFVSVLRNGNIAGTQFHPEKSHRYGMTLLRNFVGRY